MHPSDSSLQIQGFTEQGTLQDEEIASAMGVLPSRHLQQLCSVNCDFAQDSLRKDSESSSLHSSTSRIQGRYYPDRKEIYIYDCSSKWTILYTLFHEIGHHVYSWHCPDVLRSFWREKVEPNSPPVSKYGTTDPEESFAESYMHYILEPFFQRKESLRFNRLKFYFMTRAVFYDQNLNVRVLRQILTP